jgi:hypothetical protein
MKTLYQSTLIFTILTTLLFTGCSAPAPLMLISDACTAATVAIPILEAGGVIQPGIGNIILAYTASVSEAASKSSAELLTNDTTAQKSEKIIGYFAAVATPALGPTVGPEVEAIVKAIESAVNLFLSQFNTPHAKKLVSEHGGERVKLSSGDRHALGALRNKFDQTAVKAKGLIKH